MFRSFKLIEISKSTLYFLLWKLSLMVFGLISTILVGHFLTLSTQGYYYTFLSLAGLKVIVELGFSSIITTFIAHEDVFYTNKNYVRSKSFQRVSLISKFAFKWFAYAGIILMFLLFIIGYFFFSIADQNPNQVFWTAPWIFFVFCTSLNLFILPFWAILEGIGESDNVYYYRFIQVTISSAISCIALYNGAGLWALSFGSVFEICCALFVIYFKYSSIFKKLFYLKSNVSLFNWYSEVYPMQWRLSLSWIGGYLSYSSMVPIVFYFDGAIKAGQLGMTLVFMSAMNAFCSAWVIPKAPIFSKLISQRKMVALINIFISTMKELFLYHFYSLSDCFFPLTSYLN